MVCQSIGLATLLPTTPQINLDKP
ncbi:protein of unknown function [uncultured Sphingopyxis sp.]|uniref:Uncharacterized protein n=1 Tax=uncultured Sphingopyxis sp. TaxID=310581 RepID=A0A1Y5PP15_9SPHN|nr:protein of unknown function [uncultured Sphingopyxis sp.]